MSQLFCWTPPPVLHQEDLCSLALPKNQRPSPTSKGYNHSMLLICGTQRLLSGHVGHVSQPASAMGKQQQQQQTSCCPTLMLKDLLMLLLFSLPHAVGCTRLDVLPAGDGCLLLQELLSASPPHVPLPDVTSGFQPGIQVLKSCDTEPAGPSSGHSSLVVERQKIKDLDGFGSQRQFLGWITSYGHYW